MSIAPANSASIADGPALKLFQSTLTFGPMAFSNQPFALPTIACEWVIFGNAPTWMTLCPEQNEDTSTSAVNTKTSCDLVMARFSAENHGKYGGIGRLFLLGA